MNETVRLAPAQEQTETQPTPDSYRPSLTGRKFLIAAATVSAILARYADAAPAEDPLAQVHPAPADAPFSYRDLQFDPTPEQFQVAPQLLANPEGDRQVEPNALILHWWAGESDGDPVTDISHLTHLLSNNQACGSGGCSVQFSTLAEGGGTWQLMESETDVAYQAYTANYVSIGNEIEGGPEDFQVAEDPSTPGDDFDEEKFRDVVEWVYTMTNRYHIPLEGDASDCGNPIGVLAHKALNACADNGKPDVSDDYYNAVIESVRGMYAGTNLVSE